MPHRPTLSDDVSLPAAVNGWQHAPESTKNAHVWTSPTGDAAVGVFHSLGRVYCKVLDERVSGFARGTRVFETDIVDREPEVVVRDGVEAAVDWMARHAPPWRHPAVEPAAFEPPAGFVLERYYLEQREQIVCYRQQDADSDVRLAGNRRESEPSLAAAPTSHAGTDEFAVAVAGAAETLVGASPDLDVEESGGLASYLWN